MRLHSHGTLLTLALSAILAPACKGPAGADGTNGTNGSNALVSTTTLAAGDAHCPNGGTEIDSGVDDGSGGGTAGDGVLQSGEITSTSYVCTPATALVKATSLAYGDPNCPGGGTQIDTGLDDGSGGGTAADGILQPGEVTGTTYDCNDGGQQHVGSFEPPPGADGTFSIAAYGGNSTADGSSGGEGGYLEATLISGSAGGHVKLFKTGQVDASFTAPAPPATFDYGTQPLEVSSKVHVQPVAALTDTQDLNGNTLTDGNVHIVVLGQCDPNQPLYIWHSASSADQVTGVHITATGMLIADHSDAIDACPSAHSFAFGWAFVNEGTLTAGHATAGDSDSLVISAASYYGGPGSMIDLRGEAASDSYGGAGGQLTIDVTGVDTYWGGVVNQGTIDTSGGDGSLNAGNGGAISLLSSGAAYNTGDLLSQGGNSTTLDFGTHSTFGGHGGGITITASHGSVYNSGAVDATGGVGSFEGGPGGDINIVAGGDINVTAERVSNGDLYNSGVLDTSGGGDDASCDHTVAPCAAGDGGSLTLTAYGDVHNSGDLRTAGGEGHDGQGGNGGDLTFKAAFGSGSGARAVPGGAIWVSGNLDTHSGGGAQAGDAGVVSAVGNPDYVPLGQEVTFLGYGGGVDLHGGDGVDLGGSGGGAILRQDGCAENQGDCAFPAGSIINYVDITATGGDASSASGVGGSGGTAEWHTSSVNYAVGSYGYERLVNHGNLDESGGQGAASGGASGYVFWYGLDGVDNEGDLTVDGGAATGASGTGGPGSTFTWSGTAYGIQLLCDRGSVLNTGNLSASGGSATADSGEGGGAGGVHLQGPTVQNSGGVVSDGGDGNTTNGAGGDGADVVLQSVSGITDNTGTLSANGGAGSSGNEGGAGDIVIDGQYVQ